MLSIVCPNLNCKGPSEVTEEFEQVYGYNWGISLECCGWLAALRDAGSLHYPNPIKTVNVVNNLLQKTYLGYNVAI